jgi:DNA helicase-2/ATP-dependent DNA helicase PcrA
MAELSEKGPEFSGVFYMGRPVVTAAGLSKAFAAQSQRLTPAERLAKVRMGFYEKLAKIKRTRIAELKDELREKKGEEYFLSDRELTAEAGVAWMRDFRALEGEYNEKNMPDAAGIYRRILRDYFGPQAADGFDPARGVNYEDAAPLIVTGRLLGQIKSVDSIRHAVIDEAQDWSYMQFLALALTLRCSKFTILGDPAQAVDRLSAPVEPQRLAKAFGKRSFKAVKLGRTYRSTREITEFAASLIGADVSGAMDRHGEKPRTVCEPDEKRRAALVREAAMAGLEKHSTVAVITRTVAEAARLAELIGGQGIKLITDEDAPYQGGAAIMPACLTKGLEFDSVIVTGNFSGADSSLVYVCCTRALHSLTLILPEKIF